MSPRVRRVHQAFVASTDLRPMARQLLQDRTPAAYAGVEAYARRHAKEDAGALAWLVVGYAHTLDHDYAKAVDPLNRAKPHAGDLGEYVTYYLGTSYAQSGRGAEAIATLSDFEHTYPDSLLIRDAHIVYASALVQEGRPKDAVTLLEGDRRPFRVEVEWNLGRAYEAAGEPAKAVTIFRNIYWALPLSDQADGAGAELKKLATTTPIPPPSWDESKMRADLLVRGKRYSDAAQEYRGFLGEVPAADRPAVQLALASALQKGGQGREARSALDSLQGATGDVGAQRLFLLGEIARAADDDNGFLKVVAQLRQEAPTSTWLEQALLSAGNIFLLKRDYDNAIDAYRELQERYPNGSRASYAHWKAAWLTFLQGRNDDAKKEFEEQIELYPAGNEIPAAIYWRARLAQQDGETTKARVYYQKLSDRFRNYYYADLARKQLKALPASSEPVRYALLDRIPPLDPKLPDGEDEPPSDNLRIQKAELLGNGALVDLAAREIEAAAQGEKGDWVAPETARIFQESEQYKGSIEVMKRAVPNYFALDIPALPRPYWEALFPRPYWSDLKRFSVRNRLDPFLVASLIRQESEFDPAAVSHANAVGLMQLLAKTGKVVAKQEKLRGFNASQLFTPAVNLQLGTRYFRDTIDQFGSLEYALAAYNAGSDRVQDWLAAGKYRDPQEFVESIPLPRHASTCRRFCETRKSTGSCTEHPSHPHSVSTAHYLVKP